MPIIAGGIYKGEHARSIVKKMCQHIATQLDPAFLSINKEEIGIELIAGLKHTESDRDTIVSLGNGSGLLAGRLFAKNFQPFDPQNIDLQTINATQGKYLGETYWGRYIFLSFDCHEITIYRDPQGLSTLFYMPIEGGYLFASHLSLMFDALEKQPEYNWTYLTSFISSNHNFTTVTPFINSVEAIPGCATKLSLHTEAKVTQFWNPVDYLKDLKEDTSTLEEKIFDTLAKCTSSWTAGSHKIILELSGGLDSSSLLAIMKHTTPDLHIEALNIFHPKIAASDERSFAQDVADMYKVPLFFLDESSNLPFAENSTSKRFDRPSSTLLSSESDEQLHQIINIGKNDDIMCGQGGDHLFLAGAASTLLVDYYLDHGFNKLLPNILEISAFHRIPLWKLFQKSLKTYVQYKKGTLEYIKLVNNSESWMNESFIELTNQNIFKPFFWESLKNVPPEKAKQIISILSATLYVDRGESFDGKITLNPLLSQPLVELALSIPSYLYFKNGYDRYLFRQSMAQKTQGTFIWRKSKGDTTGISILGLRKHFSGVQSLLLEGTFVKSGFIDKKALQHQLNLFRHGNTASLWPIFNLFVAEKWLNSWKEV